MQPRFLVLTLGVIVLGGATILMAMKIAAVQGGYGFAAIGPLLLLATLVLYLRRRRP